jgi:hypothetical protein
MTKKEVLNRRDIMGNGLVSSKAGSSTAGRSQKTEGSGLAVVQKPIESFSSFLKRAPRDENGLFLLSSCHVSISPEEAEQLLAKNTKLNRKIDPQTVTRYADLMERGQWHTNGIAIAFDRYGNMKNGQHRSSGVVKSKKTVVFLVSFGEDENAFHTYGRGKQRNTSDIVYIDGIKKYPKPVSGTAKLAYLWLNDGLESKMTVPDDVILAITRKHRVTLENSVRFCSGMGKYVRGNEATALHFLVSTLMPDALPQFEKYLRDIKGGSLLSDNDPAFAVREMMIDKGGISGTIEDEYKDNVKNSNFRIFLTGWNYAYLRKSLKMATLKKKVRKAVTSTDRDTLERWSFKFGTNRYLRASDLRAHKPGWLV